MYRIEDQVYAKETGHYGKSLFAKKSFKKDELVFVAFGPIVNQATKYTIPIDYQLKIDPTRPEGNLCKYICHSCEPNLGIRERTLFVAFKDIEKDEEVTVDYAMLGYEYGNELSGEERICHCGRESCRGKLGCYKELLQNLREKYRGYISDYLLKI
ncbi:MAG: SET domain-containing protein-lysine N-methyltransferase [Candidatus Sungbacteria bacterium]|uniref:SET domain-containing protein-lysine N-methyltransferase n=1 Tax=Candidatus Sungiibacteriota bacterium TaxID=2750080 RepID=A0A931WPJ1_9BACT|nr:SET domain-containing protein-lysine N-methyltransferase [Candidatus Sungbacteria bacterium]